MHTRTMTLFALATTTAAVLALSGCASEPASTVADDCTPAHEFETVTPGVLTAVITEAAPFSSYTDEKATGTDADIVKAFADAECLDITYTPLSYSAAVPEVQSGRADIALGGFYRSTSRAEIVDLTDPLYLDQMAVISKDGTSTVSGLEGKKVGTIDGYIWVDDMKAVYGDNLSLYPTITDMKADLDAGRIDAGVEGYAVSSLLMAGTDYTVEVLEADDRISSSVDPAQIGLPLSKENTAIATAFNADLAALRDSGKLADILTANGLDASAAEVGEPRLLG